MLMNDWLPEDKTHHVDLTDNFVKLSWLRRKRMMSTLDEDPLNDITDIFQEYRPSLKGSYSILVQGRYSNFSWFTIFMGCFLANIFVTRCRDIGLQHTFISFQRYRISWKSPRYLINQIPYWLAVQLPSWTDAKRQFLWIAMHIMNDLKFLN